MKVPEAVQQKMAEVIGAIALREAAAMQLAVCSDENYKFSEESANEMMAQTRNAVIDKCTTWLLTQNPEDVIRCLVEQSVHHCLAKQAKAVLMLVATTQQNPSSFLRDQVRMMNEELAKHEVTV